VGAGQRYNAAACAKWARISACDPILLSSVHLLSFMPLHFSFLADHMDAIPVIAKWYYDEWGHLRHGNSLARTREEIEGLLN
jgi:hypothetical protein